MKKYIIFVLLIGVLLISFLFISSKYRSYQAKVAYEAAQHRCRRDNPIVVTPTYFGFSNEQNGIAIYLGSGIPKRGDAYYCTVTEMKKAGFTLEQLDRLVPPDIKKLYP